MNSGRYAIDGLLMVFSACFLKNFFLNKDSPPQADGVSSGRGFIIKSPLAPLCQRGELYGTAAKTAGY
jgi:hypothetical protein